MANYGFSIPTGGYDNEDRLVSYNRTSGLTQSWNLSLVGDWNSVTTHGPTHELLTGGGSNVVIAAMACLKTNDVILNFGKSLLVRYSVGE